MSVSTSFPNFIFFVVLETVDEQDDSFEEQVDVFREVTDVFSDVFCDVFADVSRILINDSSTQKNNELTNFRHFFLVFWTFQEIKICREIVILFFEPSNLVSLGRERRPRDFATQKIGFLQSNGQFEEDYDFYKFIKILLNLFEISVLFLNFFLKILSFFMIFVMKKCDFP